MDFFKSRQSFSLLNRGVSIAFPGFFMRVYIIMTFFLLVSFISTLYCAVFPLIPGQDVVGQLLTVQAKKGDSLSKLGKQYDIGFHEIRQANPGVDRLRIGQTVHIPTAFILPPPPYRTGIVINMTELRLYYFPQAGNTVMTFPVGLGRVGWRTPTMETQVVRKKAHPSWRVPRSIQRYMRRTKGINLPPVVPPGPDNPLGPYAIYLGRAGYLIHGTNQPHSIGRFYSSGCIRMQNRDIKTLFEQVGKGIPVHVLHHMNKIGWREGALYLEAHPAITRFDQRTALNHTPLEKLIEVQKFQTHAKINWTYANTVLSHHTGIPEKIGIKLQ